MSNPHVAVCINNRDFEASLEVRKLYEIVPDVGAETNGMIRVIDESGEDYLYPAEHFLRISLPESVERAVSQIN